MSQMQAFQADSTSTLIRPMWSDPVLVKRFMDVGSQSLLFPMIQLAVEAETATKASALLNDGFTFVACGSDIGILACGADKLLADVKKI